MENQNNPTKPIILTPKEARQGEISGRVLTVLTASLVLAIIVGIAFVLYYT